MQLIIFFVIHTQLSPLKFNNGVNEQDEDKLCIAMQDKTNGFNKCQVTKPLHIILNIHHEI